MTADRMTDSEIRDLATKVESFAKGLSPSQQALFAHVLSAGGGLGEVKGYSEFEPFQLYDVFASAVVGKTDTFHFHSTEVIHKTA